MPFFLFSFFLICRTIQSVLLSTNFLFFLLTFDAADAPKNVGAQVSLSNIREGETVTLTCSASGNPQPKYTWFKNKELLSSEARLEIPSIRADQNGSYVCEAENDRGKGSATVNVTVTCESSFSKSIVFVDQLREKLASCFISDAPEVEIRKTSPASEMKEGDEMTLTCHVTRSNPAPRKYYWYKDDTHINSKDVSQYSRIMEPEDSGYYKCEAENSAGRSSSQPHEIRVLCKFQCFSCCAFVCQS